MTHVLVVRHDARPWTLNVERQGNRWARAKLTAEWRHAFALRALAVGAHPFAGPVEVTARPVLRNRAAMPDTGACIGAAKAAIDGLVDAGVLPEDGPDVVKRLVFEAPVVDGVDALVIEVAPWAASACPGRVEHVRLAHRAEQAESEARAAQDRLDEALEEVARLGRDYAELREVHMRSVR